MSSIDERIVSMKFDNSKFESGIKSTLSSLDQLKSKLNMSGAAKSLEELDNAGKNFSLAGIGSALENISSKFSAMSIVGITALATIASKAVNVGLQMAKSLTVDPIKQGLEEYETNLNSIQTILANTQSKGSTLKDVNSALQELNTYSDKTIYNFSEMARNIGTFTSAGVDLKTSTASIKGIANLAALSGSNSQQASTAMYQLSQAISSGTVKLMDWNSVVNAGMGGAVFQDALKQTARTHGIEVDAMIKKNGSFRDSLQEGWLSADVLTETLQTFTGDLSESQIKALGYTDEQTKAIMRQAKTASDAATKVKTFSQLIGTLQEAVGSGWTQSFQTIFGDFEEAKALWTNVSQVLGGMVNNSANARNKMLGDWKELGGRDAMIEAIAMAFKFLMSVIKPIKDAFHDIFPPATGKTLYAITEAIWEFAASLKMGSGTAEDLRRTFRGVFAVLDIGWQIIKGVFTMLGKLFGAAADGTGSILKITGGIGDFLVSLDKAIKKGDGLNKFFEGLGNVLKVPIDIIKKLAEYLASLFDGFDDGGSNKVSDGLERVTARLQPLSVLAQGAARVWSAFGEGFRKVAQFFAPLASKVGDALSNMGSAIANAMSTMDFSAVFDLLNTGLFATLILMVRKFFKTGFKIDLGGGGLVSSIKSTFGALTDTLGAMQAQLKAKTLLMIAGAIGILTASVVALSLIDSGKLTIALGAIAVMFGELAGAMVVLEKITSSGGFIKMPFVTASLMLLAGSMLILSGAIVILSSLSWEELAKGLTGLGGAMVIVGLAARLLPNNLAITGAGLVVMSVGIMGLAAALKILATLSWDDIGRSMVALGAGLALVAGGLYLMQAALPGAAALTVASVGLLALGVALKILATLSWDDIGRSMVALGGSLLILAVGLTAMIAALPGAAALTVASVALIVLAGALKLMSLLSWEDIGKAMVVLGGSMLILAGGLYLMSGAIGGAAALIVAATALAILTPVLLALGTMSWDSILRGLTMLAGTFVVIGVAGLLLTPVIPTLLGLGAAILLLGVGTLAAGAGLLAFSVGLTALSVAGAAGAAALVTIVSAIIGLIPMALEQIAKGIVAFAGVIARSGPQMTAAMTTMMLALLNALNRIAPKLINTLVNLVMTLVHTLEVNVPKFVASGMRMITGILNGIANNIGKIVTAATNIVVNFLNGISRNLPRIIQSGVDLIVNFVEGLARAIRNNSARMNAAGLDLAKAIIDGMVNGISNGVGAVVEAAKGIASGALDTVKNFLGIHSPSREFYKLGQFVNEGFAKGLSSNSVKSVQAAYSNMKKMLSDLVRSTSQDVVEAQKKLQKLTEARKKDAKAIREARQQLVQARSENLRAKAGYSTLTKTLSVEERRLESLGKSYEGLTSKIKDANKTLEDAKKTRDDYNNSIKSQYSSLNSISKDTTLQQYTTDLQQQINDTLTFASELQDLHNLGLNDKMYKKLLEQGTGALPFVHELLASGKTGVDQINGLGSALDDAASKLGNTASTQLYQAAVDSAAGLVKGLQNQQKNIEKEMDKIADSMVNSLKKKLGIHSPSREFAKIGGYSTEGLAKGLSQTSRSVERAAEGVGYSAISSLKKSISGISSSVSSEMDMNPTIRPVLDLSSIKKDAGLVTGLIKQPTLTLDKSYESASAAASAYRATQESSAISSADIGETKSITFIQNNNSPKALSQAEIYRNTKNQLSKVKGDLTSAK